MALLDTLNFLAPGLSAVDETDKNQALSIAAGFRPECLDAATQDMAQVYYAVWLLYDRLRQTAGADAGIAAQPAGVKSIKEGDVTVTWMDGVPGDTVIDPSGFYGRWQLLNDLCSRGGITVGTWRPNGGCSRY